jgi:hypothetical protein
MHAAGPTGGAAPVAQPWMDSLQTHNDGAAVQGSMQEARAVLHSVAQTGMREDVAATQVRYLEVLTRRLLLLQMKRFAAVSAASCSCCSRAHA